MLDTIQDFIECDLDEDFEIKSSKNKITIYLEGRQFKEIGEIIIQNNSISYHEKNHKIHIQLENKYELKQYLFYMLEEWVNHYGPRGDNNFKSIFN